MRYHSLVLRPTGRRRTSGVTGWSADRPPGAEIMGLGHRAGRLGVQFHPESVGTAHGKRILINFLAGFQPAHAV